MRHMRIIALLLLITCLMSCRQQRLIIEPSSHEVVNVIYVHDSVDRGTSHTETILYDTVVHSDTLYITKTVLAHDSVYLRAYHTTHDTLLKTDTAYVYIEQPAKQNAKPKYRAVANAAIALAIAYIVLVIAGIFCKKKYK